MKTNTILLLTLSTLFSSFGFSQEDKVETKNEAIVSYYEKRGKEDAAFEQSITVEEKQDEAAFWAEQKAYEKELKRKDKKAYRAYMRGKKDAYAEHATHCSNECHHSDYYHSHVHFYYQHHSQQKSQTRISTNLRLRTPSRIGLRF
jgi:hypothetical protein